MKNFIKIVSVFTVFLALAAYSIKKDSRSFYSQEDWLAVREQTTALKNALESKNLEKTRFYFTNARLKYKQVEWIVCYMNQEVVTKKLNGAPLPKLEENAPEIRVLEPKGLQRLEELIQEENYSLALTNLMEFEKEWLNFKEAHLQWKLTDRMNLEAARQELIRIGFLHVTGFENPGFTNGVEEAEIALNSTFKIIKYYSKRCNNVSLVSDFTHIEEKSKDYFVSKDFDSFDRLGFIKDIVQPSYELANKLQDALNIERRAEVFDYPIAVSDTAIKLFSVDFLDRYYFTNLTQSSDNVALRNLGKKLFFDKTLSNRKNRSCATCHNPKLAFTDGYAKSIGGDGTVELDRNSPGLINAVYADRFFYDLRAKPLEMQFEHVIFNENEFNSSYQLIVERISEETEYKTLFKSAFPSKDAIPSKETITTALASYVASLVSFNSRVDLYINEGSETLLSAEEKLGFNLFMGKASCGTCHFAPTFSGLVPPYYNETESEILGVPESKESKKIDKDIGRAAGTLKEGSVIYMHSFKTTTVRNVELTGPYMHNGVFKTLEEVLNFYNNGGGEGHGYQVPYQTLPSDSLGLDSIETNAVIAFMKALTDTASLTSR
ncbi:MAG: cytochrome-c peroxidase [Schleiferiaceae bacterium]|nr:cytochrome-c peroxidase [Schleiferiaceae bacterium]